MTIWPAREFGAGRTQKLEVLAGEIGERNSRNPKKLDAALAFIEGDLKDAGYVPSRHPFKVGDLEFANVEARIEGSSKELFVLGAHYDTALFCPGANDDGTGVVALLELARRLRGAVPEREIRFVFFANTEPPYFGTEDMGSARYAAIESPPPRNHPLHALRIRLEDVPAGEVW